MMLSRLSSSPNNLVEIDTSTELHDDQNVLHIALDALEQVVGHFKLIAFGTLRSGLAAFGIASFVPSTYSSATYLEFHSEVPGQAQLMLGQVQAMIRSPRVLDEVIRQFPTLGSFVTAEDGRDQLNQKLRFSPARGTDPKNVNLVMMEVDGATPAEAQAMSKAIIEAWLDATKPRPDMRRALELQLQLTEDKLESVSRLIERLEQETPTLVIPGFHREIASSLAILRETASTYKSRINEITRLLLGSSRDLISAPPSLPSKPTGPKKRLIVATAVVGSAIALMLFVILWGVWQTTKNDPLTAEKLARIRRAWRPARSGAKA